MRAFVAHIDHAGLRRLTPEELIPGDELRRLAHRRASRLGSVVWALLEDGDAEALRADVAAGRHRQACGLLLNRAVELLPISAALPGAFATTAASP